MIVSLGVTNFLTACFVVAGLIFPPVLQWLLLLIQWVQRAVNMVPPPLPLALGALSMLFTLSQTFVAVHHRLQMVWTHADASRGRAE